jgi:Tfp pilus assembly protein PilO
MIDFKNKDELTTNVVICGSLAVFFLAGASIVLLPKPAGPNPQVQRLNVNRIKALTSKMQDEIVSSSKDLGTRTWPGKPEDVGPLALKQINSLLQNRKLKLVGFHADKAAEQPNVTLIPFVISVDGGFNDVMAFTRDLEKPSTKLVVNLFQVSNSNQSDDKVTASIGITAYQIPLKSPSSSMTVKPAKTELGVKKNA